MKNKIPFLLAAVIMLLGMTGCKNIANLDLDADKTSVSNQSMDIPEELMESYELHIGNDELYKNSEDNITVSQLAELLQSTLRLMYNTNELKVLTDVKSEYKEQLARKYDIVELLYLAETERLYGYSKISEMLQSYSEPLIDERLSLVAQRTDGSYGEAGIWNTCTDLSLVDGMAQQGLVLPGRGSGHVDFFLRICDLRTGEKIMTYDEDQAFNPDRTVPIKEALLTITRYYYSKLSEPEFVLPEKIGAHSIDKSLYTGSTKLPNASNQKLPEWKGMMLCHQAWTFDGANGCDTEDIVLENDIKTLSQCGFNFARIAVSFSRLQSANTLKGTVYPQDGTLNLREIEYFDKILSWGMKYGVHIQFVMFEITGVDGDTPISDVWDINDSICSDAKLQNDVAEIWGALSRRYADIPNNYLSFNLINEPNPPTDEAYVTGYMPSIEAIRKECPDRVIVADIHSMNITGEEMAKKGVALSYHIYEPRDFCVPNMYLYAENPNIFDNYSWPFTDDDGIVWDATTTLNQSDMLVTPLSLKKIAEQNNVGFMIGEWGCFYNGEGGTLFPFAYSNETREKFISDMIRTFEENDIGWSYGNYIGSLGLVTTYPVPDADLTYEKIPDSAHYKVVENFEIFHDLLIK